MPKTLTEPAVLVSTEAAISALLYLFHCSAMQAHRGMQPAPRLSQSILRHLESLCCRDELPAVLRETCDDLSDAWTLVVARDFRDLAGQQS